MGLHVEDFERLTERLLDSIELVRSWGEERREAGTWPVKEMISYCLLTIVTVYTAVRIFLESLHRNWAHWVFAAVMITWCGIVWLVGRYLRSVRRERLRQLAMQYPALIYLARESGCYSEAQPSQSEE